MGTNLTFQYDREADILYINTCSPYPEQESEELDDEIIARFNPETDEIENLEVLFFFNYRFLLVCIVRKYKSRQRENSWILTSRCRRQRELWFYDCFGGCGGFWFVKRLTETNPAATELGSLA